MAVRLDFEGAQITYKSYFPGFNLTLQVYVTHRSNSIQRRRETEEFEIRSVTRKRQNFPPYLLLLPETMNELEVVRSHNRYL